MINKCINCGYFLNCRKASKEIENCNNFVKANRIIKRVIIPNSFIYTIDGKEVEKDEFINYVIFKMKEGDK